jgi:PhoPQ-activated pathogenicity-related protein
MDTVTSYVAEKFQHDVSQFIIAGASKRGWTTWTTGAVDLRVIAIVPLVMGMHLIGILFLFKGFNSHMQTP